MIKINLLPKEFVPKKRNVIPHVVIGGLAVILFVWFGTSMITSVTKLATSQHELKLLQSDLANLEDAVKQVESRELQKLLATQKERAVEQIMAGRPKWSHALYVLVKLVPKEIWLDKLGLDSRRRPVTVDVPNPNRAPGQPPTIKKTVVQSFPALRVNGYALSPRREK